MQVYPLTKQDEMRLQQIREIVKEKQKKLKDIFDSIRYTTVETKTTTTTERKVK